MKKYAILLLVSIFFYGLGITSNLFKRNKDEKMESKKEYTFIGCYNDSLVSDNYRSDLAEITYTKGGVATIVIKKMMGKYNM